MQETEGVRTVTSEENVADLGTKTLCEAIVAEHCVTLEYVNMAEGSVAGELQNVAMFLGLWFDAERKPRGNVQMFVTDDNTVSLQNFVTGNRPDSLQKSVSDHATAGSRAFSSSSGNRHCSATHQSSRSFRPSQTMISSEQPSCVT